MSKLLHKRGVKLTNLKKNSHMYVIQIVLIWKCRC